MCVARVYIYIYTYVWYIYICFYIVCSWVSWYSLGMLRLKSHDLTSASCCPGNCCQLFTFPQWRSFDMAGDESLAGVGPAAPLQPSSAGWTRQSEVEKPSHRRHRDRIEMVRGLGTRSRIFLNAASHHSQPRSLRKSCAWSFHSHRQAAVAAAVPENCCLAYLEIQLIQKSNSFFKLCEFQMFQMFQDQSPAFHFFREICNVAQDFLRLISEIPTASLGTVEQEANKQR